MKKTFLVIIILALTMSNFSAFAHKSTSLFSIFNISKTDISAITIQYIGYGIPEQKAYTLEDKALIDTLITQLDSMEVVQNDTEQTVARDPSGILKINGGGYEIWFKSPKAARTFWIACNGKVAEFNSTMSSLPNFKYFFTNKNIKDWLSKAKEVSSISESQKQNIPLASKEDIKVFITIGDIKMQLYFDAQPKVINGTTMIPVRNVGEALGASVSWNGAKQEVALNKHHTLILRIGDVVPVYYPKGDNVTLEVAPFIENGRTYVPLRIIAEVYNMNVDYDGTLNAISITDPVEESWCVNKRHNFKIKIYEDYTFEDFMVLKYRGKSYEAAAIVIPFYTYASLSRPVTSIITAGRIEEPINILLDDIKEEHASDQNYSTTQTSHIENVL